MAGAEGASIAFDRGKPCGIGVVEVMEVPLAVVSAKPVYSSSALVVGTKKSPCASSCAVLTHVRFSPQWSEEGRQSSERSTSRRNSTISAGERHRGVCSQSDVKVRRVDRVPRGRTSRSPPGVPSAYSLPRLRQKGFRCGSGDSRAVVLHRVDRAGRFRFTTQASLASAPSFPNRSCSIVVSSSGWQCADSAASIPAL